MFRRSTGSAEKADAEPTRQATRMQLVFILASMQGGRWAAFGVFMPENSGGAPSAAAGGKRCAALAGMTWDVNEAEAEDLKTRRYM